MANTRTPPPSPNDPQESLQAAAFVLEEKSQNSLLYNNQTIDYLTNGTESGEDAAAWFFWKRLPEVRYVGRYISNALSIATLFAGKKESAIGPPTQLPDTHPAAELLAEFAGGFTGQSDLLDRLGLHLTVTGDSVLIGPKSGSGTLEAPFDQWRVYSSTEVHSRNGKVYLLFPGNAKEVQIPPGAMAVRIWRPSPRTWWDADSPVKGSFQVLKELDMLNMHIISSAASRLVGNGLLLIPEEFDLPSSETETEGTEVDQFIALLIEVMSLAKKNPESPAAQIPVMARGPGDVIDKWKHMDFSTEFSNMVPELRLGAIRRLALGMDIPPEVLLGSADSNSWCLDEKTKIYTRRGWLSEPDLEIGDVCLSLNHETGMSEWQPVTDIYRKDVVNEPMVSIEGSWHSSLTTMGHRWPVLKAHGRDKHWEREWVTSADILEYGVRRNPASNIPMKLQRAARLNGLPTEPKYQDALVELVAWMFTEGSIGDHNVRIYQSHTVNPGNCSRIRSALTALYGPQTMKPSVRDSESPQWREVPDKHGKTSFSLNKLAYQLILDHCPHRMVTREFIDSLTYSQLKLFLETAALGDGNIRPTGNMHIGQKDPHMLDGVERAAILAGLGVSRYSVKQGGFDKGPQLQHYVSITPNRLEYGPRGKNITEESYTGRIWCPTVAETHSIFIMRDGKTSYTGNSSFQTDASTVRLHLVPLLQLICSSLTVGWLHPMLEQLPLTDAQKEEIPKIVIHFDVSKLQIHQDISGDAQALYDRYGIDADALRMATGYSGDSAPDNKELARQILLSLVATGQPELVLYALGGLRDNFGIKELPKPPAPPELPAPGNQPGEAAAPKATTPIKGNVPGERSQAKQVSPPPKTKADGDQNNNSPKT